MVRLKNIIMCNEQDRKKEIHIETMTSNKIMKL